MNLLRQNPGQSQKTIPPDSWEHLMLEKPGEVEKLICRICKPRHCPQGDPQHRRLPVRVGASLRPTQSGSAPPKAPPGGSGHTEAGKTANGPRGWGGPAQSSLFSFVS